MPAPLRPIARRALAAQSDERLIKLVRDGHEPAFEEVVRRYRGPLVGFAAAITSADGAEDVVQASLEKAHRALLADEREITLRPWLFAIVRNGALNAIRGEPRVDELDEAAAVAAGPSELAEQRDDLNRLVVAMCALPEPQRQALVKRELEGVGHGEIAAQLDTTATAVRGLIFRARTGLRDAAGAVVPLPVLRSLLTEGAAAGVAGGGASMALLGGAGAKSGTAVAAAVVALGTGIAIERGQRDDPAGRQSVAQASQQRDGSGAGGDADSPVSAASAGSGATSSGEGSGESDGESGGGADDAGGGSSSGPGSGSAAGASDSDDSGGEGESEDERTEDGDTDSGRDEDDSDSGDSSGPGEGDDSPEPDDDGGSSGPGSGSEEPEEDDSSGSGSGGTSGSSGSGSGTSEPDEPDEPDEPEPLEDDSSGSGSSGSGSSGSGSGSSGSGSEPDVE